MNKKTLAGLNTSLIGVYSEALHQSLVYFQINFTLESCVIGIVSTIFAYFTTLLIIWLNFPDSSTYLQKRKIEAAIARLEKQKAKLGDNMPERQYIEEKIVKYRQLLSSIDEKEIESLISN